MRKSSCQTPCAAHGRSHKPTPLMPNIQGDAPPWFGKRCGVLSSLRADGVLLLKDRSGSMFVYILIILTFLLTFSGLVGEYYRIHSIQTHLEYELQRAVNIAVEEAMQDSWRQDKVIRLDTAKATQNVHDYLRVWLDLNGALEKWQGGTLVYSLKLSSVSATEDPPRMHAQGKLFIPSQYPLFVTSMEIPFNISSRNGRLD